MTTAIDSNILIALWNEDDTLKTRARSALDTALMRGSLVVAAPVFAELLAAPARSEAFLDSFAKKRASRWTGISTKLLGELQAVPSSNMLFAEDHSGTPAHAEFLPTSSSELMPCTMGSVFSPWMIVCTERLFPALRF